ncbi:MAG TPA: bifunctional adenosylcobinamide kinase/adenosylcobinamide-phosphate guanylyltransferase [Actinomycetota bacterium]|nr:bifunctional adenosylcobinamide kinase/adenosylcobinamide-phosphate guanylyltransferase [Actinomycetota bacterium]
MSTTLLIGGARSGKSALALEIARKWGGPVTFIATAEPRDDEMSARIAQHRADRDPAWTTLEEPIEMAEAISRPPAEALIVLDCLTLWVSNLFDRGFDRDGETRAREASAALARRETPSLVITNEVGSGIVPENAAARAYRDLLGSINSIFAADAQHVLFVSAGHVIPMKKPGEVIDDVLDR